MVKKELKLNRGLAALGLLSFISVPFTGLAGIAGGIAIYSGMFGRNALNKKAREKLEEEKKKIENLEEISQKSGIPYSYLSRQESLEEYEEQLKSNAELVKSYLKKLSKKELKNLNKIIIPYNKNSLEVKTQ